MPDLWDINPDNVFSPPDAQTDPATSDHGDYTQEISLKDDRGNLRLPALRPDRAGDRFGDSSAADRRPAGPAHLAPAMPPACLIHAGDSKALVELAAVDSDADAGPTIRRSQQK